MKQLEITTNKRLLIVEYGTESECAIEWALMHAFKNPNIINHGHKVKPICGGKELNEEIAYEMVDGFDLGYFVDYFHPNPRAYKLTALESFISAIESKGYHWGENQEGKSRPNFNDYSSLISYQGDCRDWDLAESRTFNPSKCIIFEIN